MNRYLITLSSPIAVKNGTGIRMVNVVEATIGDGLRSGVEGTMEVWKYYDATKQEMITLANCIVVSVKASNLRSKQCMGRIA